MGACSRHGLLVAVSASLGGLHAQARFLSAEEREWLHERNVGLGAEAVGRGAAKYTWGAVSSWRTWHLAIMNLVANIPKCEAPAWN
jgi:hypothetical protein